MSSKSSGSKPKSKEKDGFYPQTKRMRVNKMPTGELIPQKYGECRAMVLNGTLGG